VCTPSGGASEILRLILDARFLRGFVYVVALLGSLFPQRETVEIKIHVTKKTFSLRCSGKSSHDPLWRWGRSMTLEFVDGIIVAMLPSMLTVAWMVWRAA